MFHGRVADQRKSNMPMSVEEIEIEAIEPEDLEPRRIELGRILATAPYQIQ